MKLIAAILMLTFFTNNVFPQQKAGLIDSSKIPIPYLHYQDEYAFDISTNPAKWNEESKGLNISFVSTDKAYFRTEVPSLTNKPNSWKVNGWKGERVNTMILAWSSDTINQIRFVLHDLKDKKGNSISKNNIHPSLVRYVISNYPYDANEVTCGDGPVDKAWLLPDRLESFERFELPGKTVRPVWLAVDIPASTIAGVYSGNIEVISQQQKVNLTIELNIQNQILPKPHDWSFRLDLWQNPWVIAKYYKVKPWSEAHKLLLKQHLKLYADAGGKYITTYAVNSPWADNSYITEGTMIEWIKKKNGYWKFDYNIFDQYVQLAMEAGINKAITIYTPIPWGDRFRYIDESTGNYVTEEWNATSATFKNNWNIFLTDLKKHLEKKGWFNKVYLGVNENEMEQTLSAIKVIKEHSKQWKITYAGNWHKELDTLLDDYSCVIPNEPSEEEIKNRREKKQTSTYYICCTPAKPNTFIFSPPVEGRWLGWYAFAKGYDGLLRWAYDAWMADPVRDARHVYWPAGDAFMVYPGAESSIRFEKMREGIADYEKLKIMQDKVNRAGSAEAKKSWQQMKQHLQSFINEKKFDKEELEKQLQKALQLRDELDIKLTAH